VHDPRRIKFIDAHLRSLHRAVAAGVPVKGYFVWSILDNFEWSMGYSKRFGLVYVDYASQRRIPKDSYAFYQKVIKNNGV
jgi:beta-glucosidase